MPRGAKLLRRQNLTAPFPYTWADKRRITKRPETAKRRGVNCRAKRPDRPPERSPTGGRGPRWRAPGSGDPRCGPRHGRWSPRRRPASRRAAPPTWPPDQGETPTAREPGAGAGARSHRRVGRRPDAVRSARRPAHGLSRYGDREPRRPRPATEGHDDLVPSRRRLSHARYGGLRVGTRVGDSTNGAGRNRLAVKR
jgi:hypothetical protein